MCADNGVVEEGVTQTGQEVTAIVTDNFLNRKATASILCSMAGADIFPVDIGVAAETHVIDRKIAWGTKNMTKGPAMTREEAQQALETGISMVEELKNKGYSLICHRRDGYRKHDYQQRCGLRSPERRGGRNDRPGRRPFLRGNDTEDQCYQKSDRDESAGPDGRRGRSLKGGRF